MAVQNYRELIVWQKAMDLVELVYRESRRLPSEEKFGLVSQMRRAAVSIPSNIAEGQSRSSTGEFIQFLGIANGSLAELETQIAVATRLKWLEKEQERQLQGLCQEITRMLNGLIAALRSNKAPTK